MGGSVPYRRVLLKVSGEALCAPGECGIDGAALAALVAELAEVHRAGTQIALVIGGGNFIRGKTVAQTRRLPRATADAMGMLATVMNALALGEALNAAGIETRVLSAVQTPGFCEPYVRARAIDHLGKGRMVVLAGGTGSPFFTTDTCAALRAAELGAEVLMKATKVGGVYDADPTACPAARKFDRLTCAEVLARRLGVMDLAAISLCMEARIPVLVFRLAEAGALAAAIAGERVGTVISPE